jgi:branched-chain amino acid aminotransferase
MTVESETKPAPTFAEIISNSWVFFNGEFVRYRDVRIGLMTHAFQYGTACFEGVRAYAGDDDQMYILLLPAHFERLQQSGKILRMSLPLAIDELVKLTVELVRRNGIHYDIQIRPTLFKSSEVIGVRLQDLEQSFSIHTAPMGNYVDLDGLRCMVSSWRRTSDQAIPPRGKITGAYVNSALAKAEALDAGFDEAIMLSPDGHVSEGSAQNIFMIKKGVAYTPPVTDEILEGITREVLMKLLPDDLGIPVVERSIDRTELYTCDEVFFCGTGAQIAPVIEVDRRPVGSGTIGPAVQALQDLYFRAVRGRSPKYAGWLTPVY